MLLLAIVSVAIALGIAFLLHLWTVQTHNRTGSPNWTLLSFCNCISVALFVVSSFHVFGGNFSGRTFFHPGWGLGMTASVIYFFSIFGVSIVHSLLDDQPGAPLDTVAYPVISKKQVQPCGFGYVAPDEIVAHLVGCARGISQARTLEEARHHGRNLWYLTESSALTVGMLKASQIGRVVALLCKRTCGRCGKCEWCQLLTTWKRKAVSEITASRTRCQSSKSSAPKPCCSLRRRSPPSMPIIHEASGDEGDESCS